MKAIPIALFALALFHTPAVLAQAGKTQDVDGARDHPEIPRIEGSLIADHDYKKYDESEIPLGPARADADGFEKSETFKGERTRLLYVLPDERSPLEVERNYQSFLARRGYEPVFTCQRNTCDTRGGVDFLVTFYLDRHRQLSGAIGSRIWGGGSTLVYDHVDRFAVFKRDVPGEEGYVLLFIAEDADFKNFRGRPPHTLKGRNLAYLEIIEARPLERSLVTASAADLKRDLSASGKTVLHGILFDVDKVEIKQESRKQLEEMARLLEEEPELEVFIVGHTDNQGSIEYNEALSQRRADAVVRALVDEYGIQPERLEAKGIGRYAPVASNDTEAGRARNRRVELVKQ